MEFCFLFSLGCEGLLMIFHSYCKIAWDRKCEEDSTEAQVPPAGPDFPFSCTASCRGQDSLGTQREVQELAVAVTCCLRCPSWKVWFTVDRSAGFSCVHHSHRIVRFLVIYTRMLLSS